MRPGFSQSFPQGLPRVGILNFYEPSPWGRGLPWRVRIAPRNRIRMLVETKTADFDCKSRRETLNNLKRTSETIQRGKPPIAGVRNLQTLQRRHRTALIARGVQNFFWRETERDWEEMNDRRMSLSLVSYHWVSGSFQNEDYIAEAGEENNSEDPLDQLTVRNRCEGHSLPRPVRRHLPSSLFLLLGALRAVPIFDWFIQEVLLFLPLHTILYGLKGIGRDRAFRDFIRDQPQNPSSIVLPPNPK